MYPGIVRPGNQEEGGARKEHRVISSEGSLFYFPCCDFHVIGLLLFLFPVSSLSDVLDWNSPSIYDGICLLASPEVIPHPLSTGL
jgi:hypothetical protein